MTGEPQQVLFNLVPDDFKAWWLFQVWRPRTNRLSLWFGALATAFLGLFLAYQAGAQIPALLSIGLAGGLVGYSLTRRLMTAGVLAVAADQLKGAAAQTQFGDYSLTISPTGISERAPNGAHEHGWNAVEDLCDTTNHFFLIVAGSQAYIVPKRSFATADDGRTFWKTAHLFWKPGLSASAPLGGL